MSKQRDAAAADYTGAEYSYGDTKTDSFLAGWTEALKSSPEVKALVGALSLIATTTGDDKFVAEKALAAFRAAVEGK